MQILDRPYDALGEGVRSEKAMIGVVDGRLIFNREWRSIIRVEFYVKT